MFKSAVLKLTLWYVILALSLSLVFSTALYLFTNNEIKEGLRHQYSELTKSETDHVKSPSIVGEEVQISSGHLILDFLYLNIGVLVLSSLIGYFLAKRTLKPIKEAHIAQVRFSEEASHELKTPLTSLKIATELALIKPKENSNEIISTLKDNLKDINTLENLINYLLLVARGEKEDQFEEINSVNIASQAIENVSLLAKSKKIKIETKISKIDFKASKFKMIQLLSILLDNAIKYSPVKTKILLSITKYKNQIVIKIKDQGSGIDKSEISHIFDRYYRSKNSKNKNGFGLGLSMAKEIVKKHKGTIEVESKLNKGTSFIIRIPLN